MRKTNIKIINDFEESKPKDVDISEKDKEALLYKYYPELVKKKNGDGEFDKKGNNSDKPLPPQKRKDMDKDTQKSDKFYRHTDYKTEKINDEEVNFKINIETDMKI